MTTTALQPEAFRTMNLGGLILADRFAKPGGVAYDVESIYLRAFYERRSRPLTIRHLREQGQADWQLIKNPIEVALLPRLIDTISVLYRSPALRWLSRAGEDLGDDDPDAEAFDRILERMSYDREWDRIDSLRNLYRNVLVLFAESPSHERAGRAPVRVRVFAPHDVLRCPDRTAADLLEADRCFAVRIDARDVGREAYVDVGRDAYVQPSPLLSREDAFALFEYYFRDADDLWHMNVVDASGRQVGEQPYGEDGELPFEGGTLLPAMMIYDEPPDGRAYLPMVQDRVSFALAVNTIANEIHYLIKQEAFSTPVVETDDAATVPPFAGPGVAWPLTNGARAYMLDRNPKIREALSHLDMVLKLWASSESLQPDAFADVSTLQTGAALKVKQRDLQARRDRQIPLALEDERIAFRKLRAVHNYAVGAEEIPNDVELNIEIGRTWQPEDPGVLQKELLTDMAVEGATPIDYLMSRFGYTHAQARRRRARIERELLLYPLSTEIALLGAGDKVPAGAPAGPIGTEPPTPPLAFNPDLANGTHEQTLQSAAVHGVNGQPATARRPDPNARPRRARAPRGRPPA